jgi:spore maturation protein CgeB
MEDIGFIDGKTCYTFKSEEELKEKYKYIINNMEEAFEVAKNGFKLVNSRHGYIHRALQFILLHFL